MNTTFEVRAGNRSLARRDAATAHEALVDYARSLGCSDDEVVRLGPEAISWRGAVYAAVPATAQDADPDATQEIPPEELPQPPGQPQDPVHPPDESPWRNPEPPPWDAPGAPPTPEPRLPDDPPELPDRDL